MSGSQSNTLKEFLVSVGWQVNADQQKQFQSALDSVTAAASRLSVAVEGAASATLGAVRQMTDNLEQLYYSSQRAGTSALNMKALEFGMSQIGLNAQTAKGALESFSMAMRLNPGTEGLLNAFQIQTRDAKGKLLDTEKIMMGFLERTRNMPFFQSSQLAQMFGMDPKTFLQMQQNFRELIKSQEEFRQMAKASGVDIDHAAQVSAEWHRELRGLGSQFDLLGIGISASLQEKALPAVRRFKDALKEHQKEISDVVTGVTAWIAEKSAEAAIAVIESAEKIYKSLSKSKKFQEDAHLLGDSFRDLGTTLQKEFGEKGKTVWEQFTGDVEKGIRESIVTITRFNVNLNNAIQIASQVIKGQWHEAWSTFMEKTGGVDAWTKSWNAFKASFFDTSTMPPEETWLFHFFDEADKRLKSLSDKLAETGLVKGIKRAASSVGSYLAKTFFSSGEMSPEMQGLADTIAGPESQGDYNAQNPNSTAHGRYQFLKETWDRVAKARGLTDINDPHQQDLAFAYLARSDYKRNSHGRDLDEDLKDPGLRPMIDTFLSPTWPSLPSGKQHLESMGTFLKNMEINTNAAKLGVASGGAAGTLPVGADASGGNRVLNAHLNTTVNLHGVRDPKAAGDAVEGSQKRVGADMIRNLGAQAVWSPTN